MTLNWTPNDIKRYSDEELYGEKKDFVLPTGIDVYVYYGSYEDGDASEEEFIITSDRLQEFVRLASLGDDVDQDAEDEFESLGIVSCSNEEVLIGTLGEIATENLSKGSFKTRARKSYLDNKILTVLSNSNNVAFGSGYEGFGLSLNSYNDAKNALYNIM